MKSSTYIILFLFSILISCQNKEQKNSSTIPTKDLKDYLEIQIENSSILIGKLNSMNENIKDDYTIIKEKDTLFVIKNFLESDDFDGKEIILKDKNVKEIKLKYNISYHFNGTEKENIFLNLSYLYSTNLDSKNLIPSFKDIENRKEIISYLAQNKSAIKEIAHNKYINYYQNIPENELKNCCITDYQNYNRIKNLSESELEALNLENDLGVFLDYKSLIIEITTNSNKKMIVTFTKDNKREPKIEQQKKTKTHQKILIQ
ncbi:hypothetical protein [Chryseobacterium sp. OSA05B]|uniref:hypothetical protein n=1 Tax=Chryseobacterium sp. OSA05B TaxID=2862650 RepID=UPI001CBCD648|nr:hypothetical protein [Chryseobacterium sp. OSA05B]